MPRFTNHTTYVYDNVTGLNWKVTPTERQLWREAEAGIPVGWRIPTLDEVQGLIAGQKDNLAECNAAFGAGNLPTDWFWVYKIDPARQAEWEASDKSLAVAEALSLGSPGAFAAYFVSMGFTPINRRMERALCRYVQTD